MRNIIGQAVIGDDLYGRGFELARIRERPDQGEHLLMLAPRRRSAGQPLERLESGVLTRFTSDTSLPDVSPQIRQDDFLSGRGSQRTRSLGAPASALRRDISFGLLRPERQSEIDISDQVVNRSRGFRLALLRDGRIGVARRKTLQGAIPDAVLLRDTEAAIHALQQDIEFELTTGA